MDPRIAGWSPASPPGSRLTWWILGILAGLYVVQVVLERWVGIPVVALLAWGNPGLFRPWQPVTAFLFNGPTPIAALIEWVVLFFLLPPALSLSGRGAVARISVAAWAGAVGATLALQATGVLEPAVSPYLGLEPFITALLLLFGLARPDARILLFFVIPLRAAWVAWGTGAVTFLLFLFSREVGPSIAFFGWCGALAWYVARTRLPRLPRRRSPPRPTGRLHVLPGGRDDLVH